MIQQRWVFCLLTVAFCCGCHSGPDVVGIKGEVSFGGVAIEKGTINFIPIGGTSGPAAMSIIAGGRYEIDAKHGLLNQGTYEVRILGMRKTGRKAAIPKRMLPEDSAPVVEEEENFIPPAYNTQSTLKVRVCDLPDKSRADFHIDVKSPPAACGCCYAADGAMASPTSAFRN